MLGQRLKRGMRLLLDGREYVLEERLPSRDLRLRDVAMEVPRVESEPCLVEALFDGRLTLLGEAGEYSHLQKRVARTLVGELTTLKDDDPRKAEVRRRVAYIQAIVKARPAALTDEHITPILERVRAECGDRTAPSSRTIRRWHKEFMSAGEDVRALVPATPAKGNRTRRLCKDIAHRTVLLRLIEQAIDEEYLRLERPTVQSCYETLVARIAQDNRFREEGDKLPIPHKTTLYHIIRRLKKEDAYRHDVARFGKRIADIRHKAFGRKQEPTRALELVQCDDTQVDLFVIDEQTLMPLGRPYLMLIIDVYSRMIVGFYLSFTKPSYLSVMQALLHAIRPKTYVKTKYPGIVHTWDTYGIPEVLNVDNAKFYHGKDLEDAYAAIGMAVEFSPVRKPWLKAQIERFFGTLNTQLLHGLPGTTFSNIFEKYDYDPAKNAVISLDRLEEALHRFIIDVYGQSRHRGIEDVPARRWDESIKQHQPMLPPAHTELDVLLGHVEHRVISKKGVELFGLFYNDDCLVKLRSELKKGERTKIKLDPTNLGLVHVYDRARGRYLPVPAVARDYAEGLSKWQHDVIRRYARQRVDEHVDVVELCLAKDRIRAMVAEYAGQVRGKRVGVKASRFLNPERTSPRALIETTEPEVAGLLLGETTIKLAEPTAPAESVPEDAATTGAEDAELDLDGWGADYDLPM